MLFTTTTYRPPICPTCDTKSQKRRKQFESAGRRKFFFCAPTFLQCPPPVWVWAHKDVQSYLWVNNNTKRASYSKASCRHNESLISDVIVAAATSVFGVAYKPTKSSSMLKCSLTCLIYRLICSIWKISVASSTIKAKYSRDRTSSSNCHSTNTIRRRKQNDDHANETMQLNNVAVGHLQLL